jgi:hypothetical protein
MARMPMTRTTISFSHQDHGAAQEAAKRQSASVSQFVREAALMRARMASDKNPYPMRDLAENSVGSASRATRSRRRR